MNKERQEIILRKLMGLALFILSVVAIFVAASGNSSADKDCTAVCITIPLSLAFLFG